MASFPKEHESLYFDSLIRTQKKESVLAFIMATYYANTDNDDNKKKDIQKRLEYGYALFRANIKGQDSGAGSYKGTDSQFSSQYTLGLEMGIWKNSKLDLNDLALKVAKNEITVTKYFDIILLNYIQPVNGKIIHPLYKILAYIKKTNGSTINKSDFYKALEIEEPSDNESINALYQLLLSTSYFVELNSNMLSLSKNHNLNILLRKCNKKYLNLLNRN